MMISKFKTKLTCIFGFLVFATMFTVSKLKDYHIGGQIPVMKLWLHPEDKIESDVGKVLQKRYEHLQSFCAHPGKIINADSLPDEEIKKRFELDLKHNLLYCPLPKVGSTTWMRLIHIMAGDVNTNNPLKVQNVYGNGNLHTFPRYTLDQQYKILSEAQKMIIVRDPYSRLLSAYVNKLFTPMPNHWYISKSAIKDFRKGQLNETVTCGHDVTFPELVSYIIDKARMHKPVDMHITGMSVLCNPCQFKYDIIMKMETYNEDTLYLINKLNASKLYKNIQSLEQNSKSADKVDKIQRGFAFLSNQEMMNCMNNSEVFRRLYRVFQIHGYIGKDVKYPISEAEESKPHLQNIIQYFMKACNQTNSYETKLNKRLALQEAYGQIPKEDLLALSELFKYDCGVFGYDCKPEYLFHQTKKVQTDFFNIWTA